MNNPDLSYIKAFKRKINILSKKPKHFEIDYFEPDTLGNKPLTISNKIEHENQLILKFVLFAIFLIFLGRLIALQVIQSKDFEYLARSNKTRKSVIYAERGIVYDRNNEPLVRNIPAFSVELNTTECKAGGNTTLCEKVIRALPIQGIDITKALSEVKNGSLNILLKQNLTKDDILDLETNLGLYPGISVNLLPRREYVLNYEAAHVLGYEGLDPNSENIKFVGKLGLEEEYNIDLSGINGLNLYQIDSSQNSLKLTTSESPLPGKDIYTYLDFNLQKKGFNLLKDKVEKQEAQAGAIVAQDPNTGGVLALVNYPSFDANKMSQGISQSDFEILQNDTTFPFFNRAISASYPPGSTFKMVPASAALQENIVTKDTVIFDRGYISVNDYTFRNWKLDGHGDVNIIRALQVSNDTYFYTIGGGYGEIRGLGIDRLSRWAELFNFGEKTGVDVPGENPGFFPDGEYKDWYLGDTYITSIGQGDVLATPLQVNTMTMYFADKGVAYKPKIVKSIEQKVTIEPEILYKDLITQQNLEIVREGLKKAVEPGGTGYPVYNFQVNGEQILMGGKTGTSEYIDSLGNPATHAWFTVFAPYDNPEIVLTVFLEGGGSGADDAAPIAAEMLKLWFEQ